MFNAWGGRGGSKTIIMSVDAPIISAMAMKTASKPNQPRMSPANIGPEPNPIMSAVAKTPNHLPSYPEGTISPI